jgi:hypothetical protein
LPARRPPLCAASAAPLFSLADCPRALQAMDPRFTLISINGVSVIGLTGGASVAPVPAATTAKPAAAAAGKGKGGKPTPATAAAAAAPATKAVDTAGAPAGAGSGSTAEGGEGEGGKLSKRQEKLAAKGKLKPKKDKTAVAQVRHPGLGVPPPRVGWVELWGLAAWGYAGNVLYWGSVECGPPVLRRLGQPCVPAWCPVLPAAWRHAVAAPWLHQAAPAVEKVEKKKKARVEAVEFTNTTPPGQKKGAW